MHHLALQIPFHSVESKLAQEPSSWLATQPCPQGFSHFFFLEKSRGNEVACDKDTNCFSIVLIFEKFDIVDVAPGKGIQEIFLPVECETLILGIRNTAQGIRNPTSNYDPESNPQTKTGIQYLEFGIQVSTAIWDSLSWGDRWIQFASYEGLDGH